ncbi:type VI secretion system-associated protein TagO [Proteus cibi]|uniref:type VI secretion system-associated protein TagO n=1 Tax=Proteus cibi TaxID=2050966 RepID=UPI000D69BA26|nr:type VI secretion system-associated protein TagO [Proteus cibi]
MKKILLISVLSLSSSVFAADHQKVGDWLVSKEENKLTDKIDYYAILSAKDQDVSLVLRCQNDKTEAYLSMRDYIGSGYNSKVTLRIDKEKPLTQSWGIGEGGTSLFVPKPVSLIKSLVGKKSLISGYSPYGKTQVIAEFDLENIDTIAKEISSACNWKL